MGRSVQVDADRRIHQHWRKVMSTSKISSIWSQWSGEIVTTLKPALASINTAREYLGGGSRAKFYADVLPNLETIKLADSDKRRWVIVASMDRLIEARRPAVADVPTTDTADLAQVGPDLGQQVSGRDPAARAYGHCADELSCDRQGADDGE
jgi:hypothetical protein